MTNNEIRYKNYQDIFHKHGLFVLIFYWILFRLLGNILPIRIWHNLSKVKLFRKLKARDDKYEKCKAWWQDIGVFIHLILTCLIVAWGFSSTVPSRLVLVVSSYFILDILCYHIRVLWFDDLEIGKTEKRRKVWSHRRILFQAFINFAETILIFAVFYRVYVSECFSQILQQSFSIAFTLSKKEFFAPDLLVNFQILISIFFLVVVISVISSIGYSRPEIGQSFDKEA